MTKKLNRLDILSIVLGSIIGWGSFTLPGVKFLQEAGVINTAIGLALGGLAVIFIQQGYHIMMKHHGIEGGEFTYTYKAMGKAHGFTAGWALMLCYLSIVPLNATAFVLVLKILFGSSLELVYLYEISGYPIYLSEVLIASGVILTFAFVNIQGLKQSARVQNTMVLLLMINIVIVFISMIFSGNTDQTIFVNNYIADYTFSFSEVAKILAIIPFLFVGFDVIPQVAADMNFKPEKATRLAIISIIAGVIIYNMLNIVTSIAYGAQAAVEQDWALGTAVVDNIGMVMFLLLVIALTTAISGGINGFMIGSSKLLAAITSYGMFPERFKEKNKNGVYADSIKFVTAISLIAPWIGREVIIYIVDMASLLAAIAYFYTCYIGVKKASGMREKYLSITGAVISIGFMLLLLVPGSPGQLSTPSMIFMIIWAIAGYFYFKKYVRFA
ncbi:APC family permease [Salisediminibacterium halotolerans]|uniref:APC family permease n=1 Tax=Salisediminibacterium halotolerans TaxID=517425 RepID=UPI000EB313C9|nr:APC family permease [Salisediminibacterium halotolerans]RLJ72247.1 amino acid/polyamine/organocation transporter (APC superfamily) [Actinophytocola xinjiangensis]RPE85461.1 amino acid/polyamine/organocation transporter (APC superfamily) [Salisediminibacterium halotolerans]TWG33417.1 amino acid/polyamine/organocation transporter (APC superfamily) [Salisediminibacterium halotolerans]GEL07860.1 amino acid ABC transporter permease [Salisediminibacterium halotolerans]